MITAILIMASTVMCAQHVKIGNDPAIINSNALLELKSDSSGFLLPRLKLDSTTLSTPLKAHVSGMEAYNTNTAHDVSPGLYYNNGNKWVRINDNNTNTVIIDNTAMSNFANMTLGMPITTVSASSYTAADTDYVIVANGAANQTVTLPSAVGMKGKVYTVILLNSSITVTIATSRGEAIMFTKSSGVISTPTFKLTPSSQVGATVQSDGTRWILLNTAAQVSSY